MSLKVIENGTIRKLGYGFLFAFHSSCGRIFSRFDTIHERDRHTDRHRVTARAALCSLAKLQSRGKNAVVVLRVVLYG